VIAATLIIAALCLAASVAVAVKGVSSQGANLSVSTNEITNYLTAPFLDAPELWRVQVRALRAMEAAAEFTQKRADDALKSITVSLYAFLVGLGFAVVSVGFLIVELI
jgi:predicted PurR-regulated permease PerM